MKWESCLNLLSISRRLTPFHSPNNKLRSIVKPSDEHRAAELVDVRFPAPGPLPREAP
jgi:hypothetical protein